MKSSLSIWRYVVSVKSMVKILPIFVAFLFRKYELYYPKEERSRGSVDIAMLLSNLVRYLVPCLPFWAFVAVNK